MAGSQHFSQSIGIDSSQSTIKRHVVKLRKDRQPAIVIRLGVCSGTQQNLLDQPSDLTITRGPPPAGWQNQASSCKDLGHPVACSQINSESPTNERELQSCQITDFEPVAAGQVHIESLSGFAAMLTADGHGSQVHGISSKTGFRKRKNGFTGQRTTRFCPVHSIQRDDGIGKLFRIVKATPDDAATQRHGKVSMSLAALFRFRKTGHIEEHTL